jgi:hypothetical protein
MLPDPASGLVVVTVLLTWIWGQSIAGKVKFIPKISIIDGFPQSSS